ILNEETCRLNVDRSIIHKGCFYEVAKAEMEILTKRLSVNIPVFKHPIAAIKYYRNLMIKANVYASMGEVKPQVISGNEIEIRTWKCSYHKICGQFRNPMCIRGYALGYAIDLFSSGKFCGISNLEYSPEGNCRFVHTVEYNGELENIPEDEMTIALQNGHVLTKEEKLDLSLAVWFVGLEKIILSLYGEHAGDIFKNIYNELSERCAKKGGEIEEILNYPICKWKVGQAMFQES
ncbi:MAG: hypothetical protein QXT63_07575, partial [Thermoplasmata archaeon]